MTAFPDTLLVVKMDSLDVARQQSGHLLIGR